MRRRADRTAAHAHRRATADRWRHGTSAVTAIRWKVQDEPIDPFPGDPADPAMPLGEADDDERPADRRRAAGRPGGSRRPGDLPGAAHARSASAGW